MSIPVQDCWFLTGVTACGKTCVGIELAKLLDAEILSLDSMSIYRGMDIGTAKPTPAEQAVVVHHLLDICDPQEEFNVAQYIKIAESTVADIRTRGKAILFVGGTPLYLKSILRGLFDGPPANWKLREEIEAEVGQFGQASLFTRLEQVDPVAAAQIHPNDTRRLVRALEVYWATGQPISHQQLEFEEGFAAHQCRVFVLRRERSEQHRRIECRVEAMIAAGLVDEVIGLTSAGCKLGRTASQAVGYREVLDYLEQKVDLGEMTDRIKSRTRRFSKRQGTWFRSLRECRFVDIEGETDPGILAEQILKTGRDIPGS